MNKFSIFFKRLCPHKKCIDKQYLENNDSLYSSNDLSSIGKKLNDYETLINSYVMLVQQTKSDHINMIYESARYFNMIQIMNDDLSHIQNTMQPNQIDRYISLNNKLATAQINLR